jgi:hypothetical protein
MPKRGDIRLISSMDADSAVRLGLVLTVDEDRSTTFALLSNLAENATDLDVILLTDLTGLPFVLIAEADIVGTCWQWQLSGPLAHVSEAVVDGIELLPRLVDNDSLSLPRGMPLSGRPDFRWKWKETEVVEVQLLTGDCVRTLLEAPAIDFGFLASEGLDRDTVQSMALFASELVSAGMAVLPTATAEALGLDDLATSHHLVEVLGADAWLTMQEMLISSVGVGEPSVAPSARVLPHRRVNPMRDPLLRFVNSSLSTVRIVTWNELWDDRHLGVLEMDINGWPKRIVRERIAA